MLMNFWKHPLPITSFESFFFHEYPHPHGEEKISVNKEVLLWWKAIINFFGCLHLLFFLFRGDGRQKKRDNFLHVRAEQLLFVSGKINCIPRELISEVIYVGTSLGGGHNIYVANIHAANGCYPRRVFFFIISFLLQFFLNYAESIDNVHKKIKKDKKLHVVSVHG